MVINWYGEGCFKIQSGGITILTDPFTSDTGLTPPRFKSDITLQTLTDYPTPYEIEGDSRVILGPGEYEVQNVEILGWSIKSTKNRLWNVYRFKVEGISIGLLGHLPETLETSLLEKLGKVDILIIPTGGTPYISTDTAAKLIKQIGPKIVLASFFKVPGLKRKTDDVKLFLKEMGQTVSPEEKLTIKKKELPQTTQVVVLKI